MIFLPLKPARFQSKIGHFRPFLAQNRPLSDGKPLKTTPSFGSFVPIALTENR